MTFVRRFSFVALLALFALGLGAHFTQAACSVETEGGYPAQIVNMSNSLSADQNTLTVNYTVNAGGGCDGVANQIEYQLTVSGSVPGAGSDFDTFSGTGRGLGITGSLSIGVGALSNGPYTVTLTASGDTPPPATQSQTFTINRTAPLSVGSCSGSPNPATTGSSMTWSVPTPTGGTGSYTYAWSGTDSLSGSTRTVSKTYSTTGTKNATVIVTSGAESATKNCSITANAPASSYTLSVSKAGTGSGTVSSSPAGIDCGADCSQSYTSGTFVTLMPSPTEGSTFTGWSGDADCSDGSVTMNANKSCVATFSGSGQPCNSVSVNSNIGTNWLIGGDGLSQALYSPGYPAYVTSETYSSDPGDGGPLNAGSYGITVDTPAGYNPPTITPSATQTCSSGGSITFNLTYNSVECTPGDPGCEPPPEGALTCSGPTSLAQNTNGTFNASGGSGTYTWSASGASPASGSGVSFTTKWATTGPKTVYLNGPTGDYCQVCVGSFGACDDDIVHNLSCTPDQTVVLGQSTATMSASGDPFARYSWDADVWGTDGTPATGSGTTFSTTYSSTGLKKVKVSHSGIVPPGHTYNPGYCDVTVTNPPATGTIIAKSNLPTTWAITSTGSPLSQATQTVGPVTYANQTARQYTMAPAAKDGYTVEVRNSTGSEGSSQLLSAGGSITFDIVYTASGGTASVDIKANGSNTPEAVGAGPTINLSWTSSGVVANSCDASGDWTGNKLPANDPDHDVTAVAQVSMAFTITCDATVGGTVEDTVTVPLAQCSDGIDNDGQNGTDYPADAPGCYGADDPTEASGTPPTEPPFEVTECSDRLDNDGDDTLGGGIDFSAPSGHDADPQCTSPQDDSERGEPDIREI